MRTGFPPIRGLLVVVILGLAACSAHGAAPTLPAQPAPVIPARMPLADREATSVGQSTSSIDVSGFGNWVYTCSISTSMCPLYTLSGTKATYKKTMSIAGNPSGNFATAAGKWYVTLRGASDIQVYTSTSSGPTGPTTTLNDPGGSPTDVAVNTAHGIVAVSNVFANTHNVNSLSVYVNGATSPTRTLHFTALGGGGGFGVGVATDSAGDCFWGLDDQKLFKFYVLKFTACAGSAKIVYTSPKNASIGGVALDGSNNLYFVDNSNETIYRCTGTASCHIIAMNFQNITFIRFDSGWKNLWVTDKTAAKLYALNPSTGAIISTTTEKAPADSLALAPGPAH